MEYLLSVENYVVEKIKLVRKPKSVKSQLSAEILRLKSERKYFQILFWYLREIKALRRILTAPLFKILF